jgi:hypothetical protein
MTQSHVLLGLFCTLKRQEELKIFAHSQFSAGLQDGIVLQMRETRATCPANLDQSRLRAFKRSHERTDDVWHSMVGRPGFCNRMGLGQAKAQASLSLRRRLQDS